jgi:hypothetical protein
MAGSATPGPAAAAPPAAGAPPRKAPVTIPNDAKQALSTAFVAAWRAAAKGGSAYVEDYQALAGQASELASKEVTPATARAWCTKVVPMGKKRMQTIKDAWQAAPEPREQAQPSWRTTRQQDVFQHVLKCKPTPHGQPTDLAYCREDDVGGNTGATHYRMPPEVSMRLDDKREFAARLEGQPFHPVTHYSPDSVPPEDALWFLKDPALANGKGVEAVRTKDIAAHWVPGQIVQKAVAPLQLLAGKKFVIRMYALLCAGKVWIHQRGVVVQHATKFDPDSTDRTVQIDHLASNGAARRPLSELPDAAVVWQRAAHGALAPALAAYAPVFDRPAAEFLLCGADVLLRRDGSPVVLEFNVGPSMRHTRDLHDAVDVHVISDMVNIVAGSGAPGEFVEVDGADVLSRAHKGGSDRRKPWRLAT